MHIHIEYIAQVRQVTGVASETLSQDSEITINQLLETLVARYGTSFKGLVGDSGERKTSILLTVNDQQVTSDQNPTLVDGDRLTIISPMSGG